MPFAVIVPRALQSSYAKIISACEANTCAVAAPTCTNPALRLERCRVEDVCQTRSGVFARIYRTQQQQQDMQHGTTKQTWHSVTRNYIPVDSDLVGKTSRHMGQQWSFDLPLRDKYLRMKEQPMNFNENMRKLINLIENIATGQGNWDKASKYHDIHKNGKHSVWYEGSFSDQKLQLNHLTGTVFSARLCFTESNSVPLENSEVLNHGQGWVKMNIEVDPQITVNPAEVQQSLSTAPAVDQLRVIIAKGYAGIGVPMLANDTEIEPRVPFKDPLVNEYSILIKFTNTAAADWCRSKISN